MKNRYKILLIAGFICNFAENLIGPFYAVYVQKIGGDVLTIGFSTTLYMIVSGILIIIFGKISDLWNKEWLTIIGYSIFAISSVLFIFVTHPWQLFALQMVSAVGSACLTSPLSTLMAHSVSRKSEGLQWALNGGGNKIIIGLSVIIGTFIVKYFGFTILFIVNFVLDAIAVFVQLQLVINKKRFKN